MRIKDFYDEPHFPKRIKLISTKIQIITLFATYDEIKGGRCGIIINKAMIVNVDIHQIKKFSVTVQLKNACKLKFADHLWLPFLDQP